MSTTKKILPILGLPIVFQLVLGAALLLLYVSESTGARWYAHSTQVLAQAYEARALLLQVETNSRGYLLSRDAAFSRSVGELLPTVAEALSVLVEQVADNPTQTENALHMQRAAERVVAYHLENRLLIDRGDADEALQRVVRREGVSKMEAFQQALDAFATEERRIADEQSAVAEAAQHRWFLAMCIGVPIELALAIGGVWFLHHQIANRLSVIVENTKLLAHNKALNSPLGGGDELAEVDHTFHEMAAIILDQRRAQADAHHRLQHSATHDALTGLANRQLLLATLPSALAAAKRSGKGLAVMFIDLDGFKAVNDTHGHDAGDWVLREVAKRLSGLVRESDLVVRMGGDEFVLLLPEAGDAAAVSAVATKVLATIDRPMVYEGHTLDISASIGLAIAPQDGRDADALLQVADQAMYRAKRAGKRRYALASAA